MKKNRYFLLAATTILTTLLALGLGYLVLRQNVHIVIPGQVYRSAQPSAKMIKILHDQYHIKTIINLRGKNPSFTDYQTEIAVSKKLGIRHYDIQLHAKALPRPDQLRQLITLLEQAPKPILVHCKSGADRTGLAAAVALALNGETSLKKIKAQFSIAYLVTSPDSTGKLTFKYYIRWLKAHHYKNNKAHFLEWAYSEKPFN